MLQPKNYGMFEKYIFDLIKNDKINKLHYIFENEIFCIEKMYRNLEANIFSLLYIYVYHYLYFLLRLKDKNIKVEIDKGANFQYVSYPDQYIF